MHKSKRIKPIIVLFCFFFLAYACKKKNYNECCKDRSTYIMGKMHYINKIVIDGIDSTKYYEPALGFRYVFSDTPNENWNYYVGYDTSSYFQEEYYWESKECNTITVHPDGYYGTNCLLGTNLKAGGVTWSISEENGEFITSTDFYGQSIKLYWGDSSIAKNCNTGDCCLTEFEKGLLNVDSIPDTLIYAYEGTYIRYFKYYDYASDTINESCVRNFSLLFKAEYSQNSYGKVPSRLCFTVLKYSTTFLSFQIGDGGNYDNYRTIYCTPESYYSSPSILINGSFYKNVIYKSFLGSPYSEIWYNRNYGIVAYKYNGIKFELIN